MEEANTMRAEPESRSALLWHGLGVLGLLLAAGVLIGLLIVANRKFVPGFYVDLMGDVLGTSNNNFLLAINSAALTCAPEFLYGLSSIDAKGRSHTTECIPIGNITNGTARFHEAIICPAYATEELDGEATVKICGNTCTNSTPLLSLYDGNNTAPLLQFGTYCLSGAAKPFYSLNTWWDPSDGTFRASVVNTSGMVLWSAASDGGTYLSMTGMATTENSSVTIVANPMRWQPGLTTSFVPMQIGPDFNFPLYTTIDMGITMVNTLGVPDLAHIASMITLITPAQIPLPVYQLAMQEFSIFEGYGIYWDASSHPIASTGGTLGFSGYKNGAFFFNLIPSPGLLEPVAVVTPSTLIIESNLVLVANNLFVGDNVIVNTPHAISMVALPHPGNVLAFNDTSIGWGMYRTTTGWSSGEFAGDTYALWNKAANSRFSGPPRRRAIHPSRPPH